MGASRWLLAAVGLVAVPAFVSSVSYRTCSPDQFASGPPNEDARVASATDFEVWALFVQPAERATSGSPIVLTPWMTDTGRLGTKIVWRATGDGAFSVSAVGPQGQVVTPYFQEEHSGSEWDRPGQEWGSGWELPTAGCWTFTAQRGDATASITVEFRKPN